MSGIYISGMEMPTEGQQKSFLLHFNDDGTANIVALGYPQKPYKVVPVPPHGRLIESVELYGKAEKIKTKALSTYDKPQSWQFGVFWAIEQIEAALTNAPTIIPA